MKRIKLTSWGVILSHLLLANEHIRLPNTIWQNDTEKYIYLYYSQKKMYETTDYTISKYPEFGIEVSDYFYGFYDDCDLPSIDSLRRNGDYYFEVTPMEFEVEDRRKVYVENACGQVSFFTEKQDTFMNIYYSSRQQYVTYKKLNRLPQNVQKYLIEKGIHIGSSHKKVSSEKSIIYSQPGNPTKMYLIKGDIVKVLEEKYGWLKIEYEGAKLVTGWIKREDTER